VKMSYHRLYDSALLDDLHNYFPDLLYVPERFEDVAQVLGYVQQQVRQRFDLFSRGRREHLERERTRIISTPPLRAAVAPNLSMLFEASRNANATQEFNVAADFLNAINSMGGLFQAPVVPRQHAMAPGFLEPVVVRPTAEQIQSGTAIEIIDSEDEICAICQDQLPAGTQALSIDACGHRFHSPCINTWFSANVACPVCRHDIREPATGDAE